MTDWKEEEEWKELIDRDEIEGAYIETIQQWMEHPKIDLVINWKDDSLFGEGQTVLLCAMEHGRWDIVKLLLEHGVDVTIVDNFGSNALMYASCFRGHTEILGKLLDMGPDLKIANLHGDTALTLASWHGYTDKAKLLLDKGANMNVANKKGWTALGAASYNGHTGTVKLLLARGADTNIVDNNGDTAFAAAANRGHSEIVALLLDHGANINLANKSGSTVVMGASYSGHTNIVKLLLSRGADINFANEYGETAFAFATAAGHTDIVKLLLDKGATINVADKDGETALMSASARGHTSTVKLLLVKGADINIAAKEGHTALMKASIEGHTKVVELLLGMGADMTSANKSGSTALLWASIRGHVEVVKLLLDKGADVTIANKFGETALLLASWQGHTDTVKLLMDKGADNNTATKNGETALMSASSEGHVEIVKLLLDKGAHVTTASKNGDTAFTLASHSGHNEIVELLTYWKDKEEWKKLIDGDELMEVDIETFKQWMERPKKEFGINWKDDSIESGKTMLSCAIFYERLDIANIVLNHGADPNIASRNGWTPLMYASVGGHPRMVQSLLETGADVTITNEKGWTALMEASDRGRNKIVKLLLDKGSDLNVEDQDGDTALNLASRAGHSDTVKLLLDRDADLTVVNKNGNTVFSLASDGGHTQIMELLLDNVANIQNVDEDGWAALNMCNRNGQTLLHLTCLHNKKASAQRALQIGADKDKIDKNGHSALFYAAEKGLVNIVDLLLKHKADGNKTDERSLVERADRRRRGRAYSFFDVKDGRTPLFIAAQNGHHNVVALLLKYGSDPYLCSNESLIPRDVSGVHRPIQQLFRIHDFFDHRKHGDAYKLKYITCKDNYRQYKKEKEPIPPLEDIMHDIVKYSHFADKFLELYQENREIVNWLDQDGRSVQQVACRECREAILFLGRYDLDDKPIYESPTCKIYNALDYGGREENLTQPRLVAAKFFENEKHFENEMGARLNDDASPRFSSEFVIPHVAAYRADQHQEYAKACKTLKNDGAGTKSLPDFCLMMERGERNLMEAMNNENLSAEHKDLERRDMLQKLCKIFSYLHGMGYVHGDIKPHNVVRHNDPTVTWKAIDFDACTKIGDVVGLKLTTGSAPPEMLKTIQNMDPSDKESMGETKIVLRQPGGGLDESDLVLADPSFDVWSYGILMYQLVTGRSFFHCDLQGNVDDTGLQELANLTEARIHEKLRGVKDVNARVLLAKILRLNPKERPTMSEVAQDYYFHPSKSPQGRKAEFFGKKVLEEKPAASLAMSQISRAEKDVEDDGSENMEEIERFLSSKVEFSYFKLRDEDKDWSDKLLNSEVETFHFDKLGGMGEKPRLIDGDIIYENSFLRGLLSKKGPDYFMGFLVEYFELYTIMENAHEVCQGIKANLVSNVKDLKGIFTKLFVRGKGLNDVVRGTLFCNSIDQFKYVGRQLKERYGHNVYIKPPKKEVGAWPIPKLLIYGNRLIEGRCMSVEIQFSTVYMHLATHASNNHLVYEAIRESTGYLGDKDQDFQDFLQSLNEQYIDTEGFLRNQSTQEGRFEIVVVDQQVDEDGNGNELNAQESEKLQYSTKATGFISGGRIRCGDTLFRFMSPTDRYQRFSESSFVVNKNLTLLSSHSYWSEDSYDLDGKIVEFVVSFKGRGLAIAGIGTNKCLHGSMESDGGGSRCSVHVGRSKFVVRRSGVEEVFREKKLPNQTRAKIRFQMQGGTLSVSFVGSEREDGENEIEGEFVQEVGMPPDQRYYYLYMRAPPGVHDVKFHEVNLLDTTFGDDRTLSC